MGKYRLSFDVDIIELEKTNFFPPDNNLMRQKISIDINAKYAFEATSIFQNALTKAIGQIFVITARMSDNHYSALDKEIVSPIITEVATDEDVD